MQPQDSLTEASLFVDKKEMADQLLKMLSDNQVFLNKVQKAQWNFDLLEVDSYDTVVNLLFNSGEKLALKLKEVSGFVPADLEIYLGLSEIEEDHNLHTREQIGQDLLSSHKILLDSVTALFKDSQEVVNETTLQSIGKYLYVAHVRIFKELEGISL